MKKQTRKEKIKVFIDTNRTGIAAALILIILNSMLLIINGSWIFQRNIIEFFGDQQLYFDLANNVLMGRNFKSPYTLGYSIFYMILIVLHDFPSDWRAIMGTVISIQAFMIVPSIFFLIYRKLNKVAVITISTVISIYFLYNIIFAVDPLLKFNFLGLVPLSEPLSILTMLFAYVVYFKVKNSEGSQEKITSLITLLGFLIAFSVMVRSASIILIAPILIDMLLAKKFKLFLSVTLFSALFFIPQLAWNYWVSGSITFSGYIWWAEVVNPVKTVMDIQGLYGINSSAMFSLDYAKVNYIVLISSYIPLVLLLLYSRMWKTKLEVLVTIFTVLNIVFYLSYWWSLNGNLIDRFLLPNYFLIFYFFSIKLRSGLFKTDIE